jgi:signal transduction histidine kinase
LVLLAPGLLANEKPILIESANQFYDPSGQIYYLSDDENQIDLQEILSRSNGIKFEKIEEGPLKLENAASTYWIKFHVQNSAMIKPYLEIRNTSIDTLYYFLQNGDGKLVHHCMTGNALKVEDRPIETAALLVDMHLTAPESYTCFLRIGPQPTSTTMELRIGALKHFYESLHREYIWQGIYFGLIIFLFVYNLFLFFSIRDSSYLYFALFIGSVGLLFSLLSGFGWEFLWDFIPGTFISIPLIGAVSIVFKVLFSARFLHSRLRTPKLHLWLLALVLLNVPLIIVDIAGFHGLAVILVRYNSIMALFFLMFLAIKSWKGGYRPAKYYLLSWSFYVIGVVVSLLIDAKVFRPSYSISEVLQISSTLSILFMSFALSKKINLYIERRNEALKLVVKTAQEKEKLVSSQNQLLEAKVNERTIDLEQSISTLSKQRRDLHDANEFKDKIFSIISHDLKSPITSLAGLLQVMKIKKLNEEERSKAINSLEIALKSTKNLLDNILAWANKKQSVEEDDEIELHKLVMEVFQIFEFQARSKSIQLINKVEKGFHIVSNSDMLQLVIRNLVSNALKFTPKRGSVVVGMRQDHLNIEIFVKDSGVGMSEEVLKNLFNSSTHSTTRGTENEKGTGLGLMLCKEFVEKYNGSLHVSSKLLKGSTFTLKLNNAVPVLETFVN